LASQSSSLGQGFAHTIAWWLEIFPGLIGLIVLAATYRRALAFMRPWQDRQLRQLGVINNP
jgi:hypothetical protein